MSTHRAWTARCCLLLAAVFSAACSEDGAGDTDSAEVEETPAETVDAPAGQEAEMPEGAAASRGTESMEMSSSEPAAPQMTASEQDGDPPGRGSEMEAEDPVPAPMPDPESTTDPMANEEPIPTTPPVESTAPDATSTVMPEPTVTTPDEPPPDGTTTGDPVPPVDDSAPSSARLTPHPIGETEANLGFWEYVPPGYGNEPLPLLVFTHGAAWQGEGTLETLQDLLEVGPPNLIDTDAWPNARPFIVLAPQNPRSGCFDAGDIDAFYRYALSTYDVDRSRIYHTGQSCGAIGAWNYLANNLDEFVTAAVLISGDGRDAFAQAGCDLGRVAIWGLHNELDQAVSSAGTIETINSLQECDPVPDVELTIYPGETEHDAWTKTYDLSAGNDIYAWLLEHVHP